MAAASGRVEAVESRCSTRPSARPRARPRSRSSLLPAGPRSLLVNVPALIALHRSYLAELRGDAEATAAFASQALAESSEGEWMLDSDRPGIPGRGRMAPRPARRGRARLRVQHRRVAGGRPAHCDRLGRLSTRPGPARPGPPGRGRPDLPAGAGDHRAARPAAAAGRGPGVCGPGRGGLPAERARHRAPACHRGHRAMPAVRLHPAAGHRPGDAGVDPAGQR